MNVVIIDDEHDIGFILGFELKLGGHTASCFETIEPAQAFIQGNKVDAIICDFQMPKMNGLELFRWARAHEFRGPFYILTGEPTMDKQHLLDLGVTDVLYKPQDLNKLSELLKT